MPAATDGHPRGAGIRPPAGGDARPPRDLLVPFPARTACGILCDVIDFSSYMGPTDGSRRRAAATAVAAIPESGSSMHILIVEDDQVARDYLAKALREVGHTVDVAADGLEGLHLASSIALDLVIVDRMLPKLDGLALVQSLRATGRKFPVLILSALGDVDDRITGLRAGGDDYLTKPYHVSELLARIDALARRAELGSGEAATKLKLADLELDRMTRRVMRGGKKIELTAREFQLLEFLMRHSGQVVTRTMLLEGVWDYHFDPQTNVIDVHISRLRQAIDKDFDKPLLHTVRGAGYSLSEED